MRTRDLLDVPVAMVNYETAIEVMDRLVESREPGYVCAAPVHALMEARRDPEMRAALHGSTLVVPDGMPLVWAANLLGERLHDRVYGPELMLRYSDRCAERGPPRMALRRPRPGVARAAGPVHAPPPPRHPDRGRLLPPVSPTRPPRRSAWRSAQINGAQPDVLWVGIGVPKQEKWMARMRDRLDVPVMCGVGAAFDFHAGRISMAPRWMQDHGLEWIYRTVQEPKRLLPRYVYTNPRFVAAFARQYAAERRRAGKPGRVSAGGPGA